MGFGPFLKAYELQDKKPWGFGTEALGFWGQMPWDFGACRI